MELKILVLNLHPKPRWHFSSVQCSEFNRRKVLERPNSKSDPSHKLIPVLDNILVDFGKNNSISFLDMAKAGKIVPSKINVP